MKNLIVMIISLLMLSCSPKKQDSDNCCECHNPQNNLTWLKELIQKAEIDKKGYYWGCIWLEKFKGQNIFVTSMKFDSGGIMNWFFDCEGNHYSNGNIENCGACKYVGKEHLPFPEDFIFPAFEITKNKVIYKPKGWKICN